MKKICMFPVLLICFYCCYAQQKTIQGFVLSADTKKPISGALIKGHAAGITTTSDGDGKFVISVTGLNDSIIISHVGFTTITSAIKPGDGGSLIMYMWPMAATLDEVIVNTGIQALPKERTTGSFTTISESRLNEQTGTTLFSRLEAIASAVYTEKKRPVTGTGISIRGISSIQGPREPLIILDDFPYEGALANINPNDVSSITLLKDAAAASIWGARAGNGVIVITTKRGSFNQPMRVTVNNNISIISKPDVYYQKSISPSDFIDVELFLYGKGFYTSMINSASKPVLSPVVEILVKKANGSLTTEQATQKIDAYRPQDTRDHFDRYMYKASVNRQHFIGIAGGKQRVAYTMSAGLDDNEDNLGTQYSRVNFKTEERFKVTNKLQLTAGVFYTNSATVSGRPGYNDVSTSSGRLPPYILLADEQGNALPVMKTYRQSFLDTAGRGKLLDWNYYPLTDYLHNRNRSYLQEILATIGIQYKLTKSLQALVSYQYQQQAARGLLLQTEAGYFTRNMINGFTSINNTTGVVTYRVPKGAIRDNSSSVLLSGNFRGQLNFNKQWKQHEINALGGTDIRESRNSSQNFRSYGYNDAILTTGSIDHTSFFPNYITGSTNQIPAMTGYGETVNRYVSFYGNAGYTYKGLYTLSASARRDASNLFGVQTNDKWNPLWSTGVAWNLSKEKFYSFKQLPFLRVRLTYGVSGNADPTRAAVTTIGYAANSSYFGTPTARIDQFANPDLRWEKTAVFNAGIDWRAAGNRLSGSIEYYHKKGTDLFGSEAVDYTGVATSRLITNAASMNGSGWDLEINSINVKRKIQWETNLVFNTNRDAVKDYYLSSKLGSNFAGNGQSISAAKGRPVYALYSYRWGGLDPVTGDPQGYIKGVISKDYSALVGTGTQYEDLVYHGRALPAVFGSVGNTLRWKQLSLTARVTYKFGYYFRNNALSYNALFTGGNGDASFAQRWQKPGDELVTNVPSMTYPNNARRDNFYTASEIHVERGDHIRLQYVSLAYEPLFWGRLKKLVEQMQVYLNMNNLGLLWRANKSGMDPDYRNTDILPAATTSIGIKFSL